MVQLSANKVLIDSPWKTKYRHVLSPIKPPRHPRGFAQSHSPPRHLAWPRCERSIAARSRGIKLVLPGLCSPELSLRER